MCSHIIVIIMIIIIIIIIITFFILKLKKYIKTFSMYKCIYNILH